MQILDNINVLWGDDLKKAIEPGAKLKIAASYFSIYAYEALKKELEGVESVEFLFTSPSFVPNEVTDKISKERREFHIPELFREQNLFGNEFEIQLKNKLTQRAIAKECADWIRRKAIFKSNSTDADMQGFTCVNDQNSDTAYMPVKGFTTVDLGYQKSNAVSNFITKFDDAPSTRTWLDLFDQMWKDKDKVHTVTDSICSHIESVYRENSPEKIYFLMLFNIFNEFLDDLNEDVLPNDLTGYKNSVVWNKLFNFQEDAATGIINKLESYNGCILADSVGLGKTFTALAVIKYYELRNRSVLVLCPKKLAGNWLNYNRNLKTNILYKDRLHYDVLCHTDLQRTKGESFGTPLNTINWGNYDLVVIDESHNFRNNEAFKEKETRYQKLMRSVIKEGVKTRVLMLSATPVNNRFTDLKNQLALAYEGESENLGQRLKIGKSIDAIFNQAQAAFNAWAKLSADERTAQTILDALDFDFFELLDSVTIARSRRHIETFYDTSDIGTFPKRKKPLAYRCQLTHRADIIGFNDIFSRLSLLKLSVYAPVNYILSSRIKKYEELYDTAVDGGMGRLRQADREKSLQSLMTCNLLKRLESSVQSFRLTLGALEENILNTLDQIDRFNKSGNQGVFQGALGSLEGMENEDEDLLGLDSFTIGKKVKISLADMDLTLWGHDLKEDLIIISELLAEMKKISPFDDAKLQHLKQQIQNKIESPINPGNKKLIVFTAFADTADYLYDNLSDIFQSLGIESARVTGRGNPKNTLRKGMDFQSILTLFSPVSKEKELVLPEVSGEIDLLIATDCISEGQNLQDCDYLINYDIHWNPVRIIQRFGRIDRIGSPNEVIQLVNYWPDISLDEYINLKERVENRMVIADVTATGDDNILSAKANNVAYRKEQLRRLQDEVIELEDVKTGVSITDLGLNDFRMDLLDYIKSNGDIGSYPKGLHAVVQTDPEKGLVPGIVFTLRNRNPGLHQHLHNRLHPYYLIYIDHDGHPVMDHTRVKPILDLARSACKGVSEPVMNVCDSFNRETCDGRDMEIYSELLNQAIYSMVKLKEDKEVDALFADTPLSAKTSGFDGLDDFELVSFIVVRNEGNG